MSDRGMTPATIAALSNNTLQPIHLVRLDFDSGTVYITDAYRDIVWDGNTYQALGDLLTFEGVTETSELLINTVRARFSGVDPARMMRRIQNDDFLDRPARIWLAFLDDANDLIADPVLKFSGRMDAPRIAENAADGTAVVEVQGVSDLADYGRRPGRHGNDSEQNFYYPGDRAFEYVSQIPKTITWGRA